MTTETEWKEMELTKNELILIITAVQMAIKQFPQDGSSKYLDDMKALRVKLLQMVGVDE